MTKQISEYDQQAIDFLNKTGATIDVKFSHSGKHFDGDKEDRGIYKVTISRNKREYSFQFGQSIINSGAPSFYDILSCLTKYDPGLFEDFCSEMGYDTDSKKAEKTYNAVRDEYLNMAKLFSDDELEAMQEIQ
jgi:hypothetical protein